MRLVGYTVVVAIIGIRIVAFIMGLVRGWRAESLNKAFDPVEMRQLNETATIIGSVIGAPVGLAFGIWKQKR